jgi:hypothetical protein
MSGRTIEPATITTLEEWATRYLKFDNVVFDNGVPAVLSRTDNTVVKRIPIEKGFDLYALLQREESDEKAYDAIEGERLAQKTAVGAALPGCREAERQLLEATDAWRLAVTPTSRAAAALHVGRLSVALQEAERTLRTAEAPVRFSQVIPDLKRVDLDYRTGDDRIIGNLLQFRSHQFPYTSRILTGEDMA